MIRGRVRLVAVVAAALLLAGCGSDGSGDGSGDGGSAPVSGTPSAESPPRAEPPKAEPPKAERTAGIDASHHQGDIGWNQVADHGIGFAYLKATEGSSFEDPAFADNWAAARAAGIRTGGYHYYTLCSAPEPQADHFVDALESVSVKRSLPPVVDLELIGNCDPPPARSDLREDVETFIDRVEEATGKKLVVYFHPDFEDRYGIVEGFDRRLWVRKVGDRPPPGDWFIWQRNDQGAVPGIEGPVDLNVMASIPPSA